MSRDLRDAGWGAVQNGRMNILRFEVRQKIRILDTNNYTDARHLVTPAV
jgi:hypothetical protein